MVRLNFLANRWPARPLTKAERAGPNVPTPPKELLRHGRRAHFVAWERVLRLGGVARASWRAARMQTQPVAHIVETDAMSQLGVNQGTK